MCAVRDANASRALRVALAVLPWASQGGSERHRSLDDTACGGRLFMDDGAADHWGVTFQTHSFERGEVQLLRGVLRERFDLDANLRQNRGCWILYVPARCMSRFREIVMPHLLHEFEYKTATKVLDPVETARRPLIRG